MIVEQGEHDGVRVDGLDGVVFEPGEAYLTLATWRDQPSRGRAGLTRPSDYTGQQIYYRSIQQRETDTADDATTTCGAGTPTGSGARARSGCRTRGSAGSGRGAGGAATSTTGSSASRTASASPPGSTGWRGKPERERVDPGRRDAGRAAPPSSCAGSTSTSAMRPVWLCPLRLRDAAAWPSYPLEPGADLRQRRLLGHRRRSRPAPPTATSTGRRGRGRRARRPQVALLRRLLRPGDVRPALRRRQPTQGQAADYDPDTRLTGLYEKVVNVDDEHLNRPDAQHHHRRGDHPADARRRAVPLHGVRRQRGRPRGLAGPRCTWRTSAGCPTCSPRPGDLGLARAYVSGDLDADRRPPGRPLRGAAACCSARRAFEMPVARRGAPDRARARLEHAQAAAPAAAGGAAALAPAARGLPALQGPRRRGDPPPLRRVEPVLRDGPRPVDDLHLRGASRPRTRRSRRRRTRSTTWSPASSACSRACGCSTSAAAGAAWSRHAAKHYGVEVVGVTLSREQAAWAQDAIKRDGPRPTSRGPLRRLPRRRATPASTRSARSG